MAVKTLKLRRDDACVICSVGLSAGTSASWDGEAKTVTCLPCASGSSPVIETIERGVAGASATRQYERKSSRERRAKEAAVEKDARWREEITQAKPVLGRIATALTPKPVVGPESQSTAAWKVGAQGEQRVAEVLDSCSGVQVLHDRRVPGSKANVDHVAVGPTGVYVIDAKKYAGAVEKRDVGSWLRTDLRLYVGGRDRTKLVSGVEWQMDVVKKALADADLDVPVSGVLCFVGSTWPLRKRPLTFGRVTALWPGALPPHVGAVGPLTALAVDDAARALATSLRPA